MREIDAWELTVGVFLQIADIGHQVLSDSLESVKVQGLVRLGLAMCFGIQGMARAGAGDVYNALRRFGEGLDLAGGL
jgi:hypothetical protein